MSCPCLCAAGVAGDVLLIGGAATRWRVASSLGALEAVPSSLLSEDSGRATAAMTPSMAGQEPPASEPADASMDTDAPAEEAATESAAGRKKKNKRRRGAQGAEAGEAGGAGDRAPSTKEKANWEQVRTQLEAELERLKGENEQWKELANGLWSRLGGGGEDGDEGAEATE